MAHGDKKLGKVTKDASEEALLLSSEILADIELSRIPLPAVALKASRLARLLNDFEIQKIMQFEAGGYPTKAKGVPTDVWHLAAKAGRVFEIKKAQKEQIEEYAYLEAIQTLEANMQSAQLALAAARDPNVSISSANPRQFIDSPIGNTAERTSLAQRYSTASERLSSRRVYIYNYVLSRHYDLKFSNVAQAVFGRIRENVDSSIGDLVPTAVKKFAAVHEYLLSDNSENWANAAHSCRRILQDLADAVFPPRTESRKKGDREIKLGPDNYINRLVCFAEDSSGSERFASVVGSHLRFLGDRLDALFSAVQKGSHSTITKQEADRYVLYTYMVVGDILILHAAIPPKAGN